MFVSRLFPAGRNLITTVARNGELSQNFRAMSNFPVTYDLTRLLNRLAIDNTRIQPKTVAARAVSRAKGAYANIIAKRFMNAARRNGLNIRQRAELRTDLFRPCEGPGGQMLLNV